MLGGVDRVLRIGGAWRQVWRLVSAWECATGVTALRSLSRHHAGSSSARRAPPLAYRKPQLGVGPFAAPRIRVVP
jgi:hypothetical protein